MRRNGMRICALVCCLLLCTGVITSALAAPTENCPGSCSHEAAIGTTHYDTLAQALTAANDGSTVTILTDVTVAGGLTVDEAITLDLGGKTLSGRKTDNDTFITVTKDCTVKNGTLTMNVGCTLRAFDCTVTIAKDAVLTGSSTSPTLDLCGSCGHIYGKVSGTGSEYVLSATDGSLYIYKDAAVASANAHAIVMNSSGRLEITGGDLQSADDLITLNVSEGKALEVSITGGTFRARGGETVVVNKLDTNATAPADFVIGGTFNKVPTAYVPVYCRVTDNGDGTYTVTAEYSVSFAGNGASGSMASTKADRGSIITLPNCTYTAPVGKHFLAWEIGGNQYAPGASYAVNGDLTLKALWASHTGGYATCCVRAQCSVCGATYGDYAGHHLVSTAGKAATCTESGLTSHSRCTICGSYFSSGVSISASSLSIPALGHEMVTVKGKPATCTEDGLLEHEKCAHCDLLQSKGKDITEEDLILPATGHKLEKVAAVASTCTEPGTEAHQRCSLCKALFVGSKEVKSADLTTTVGAHVLSDWESDAATHWKTCTSCGDTFRQHSHKDGNADASCDECGYAMSTAETETQEESTGFSWLFLIPLLIAIVVAVFLILKKRRNAQ